MTSLILPEHVAKARDAKITAEQEPPAPSSALSDAYVAAEDRVLDPSKLPESALERLPQPTGWRILVLPYKGRAKTKGDIYLPDEYVERVSLATVVAYVLAVGPDCYADKVKFPNGPWCKKGDWVILGRYAGARFRIEGGEVRIINDDEVIASIANPEDILNV
jgi:co-chaperonin GroES (HSP10)